MPPDDADGLTDDQRLQNRQVMLLMAGGSLAILLGIVLAAVVSPWLGVGVGLLLLAAIVGAPRLLGWKRTDR
jgi:hypothetical protein